MASLSLPQLISNARAQWLNGDPQAWTRYVACCLKLEAEQREAQQRAASTAARTTLPSAVGNA